jgi:hypothetical protein
LEAPKHAVVVVVQVVGADLRHSRQSSFFKLATDDKDALVLLLRCGTLQRTNKRRNIQDEFIIRDYE